MIRHLLNIELPIHLGPAAEASAFRYPPPPRSGSAGVCRPGSRFFQLKVLDSCSYGVPDARASGPAVRGSYHIPFIFSTYIGYLGSSLGIFVVIVFSKISQHLFLSILASSWLPDRSKILPKSIQNRSKNLIEKLSTFGVDFLSIFNGFGTQLD